MVITYVLSLFLRRLENELPREDFLTNMVAKVKSGEVSLEELTAHSSTLMYVLYARPVQLLSLSRLPAATIFFFFFFSFANQGHVRIAGGETTATSLSAATFYVLKSPHVQARLEEEIRSRFKSYDEINATSAMQLPYLQAVIHEAMRMHPSGAHGFPRTSPGVVIDGHRVPDGVGSNGNTLSSQPRCLSLYAGPES